MNDSLKGHQAEWTNGVLIVAGGKDTKSSETCTLGENSEFNCVDISPLLDDYLSGVSFTVESNYCV